MRLFATYAALFVWFGALCCPVLGDDTREPKDAASMKVLLQKKLPVGTSLKSIQMFMEREGFKCLVMRNESFAEQGVVRKGVDFLYCDRSESAGFPVLRRWQIAVILKKDSLSEIRVSVGFVGP